MRDPARPRHPIRRVVSSLGALAIVGVAVLVASGQSGGSASARPGAGSASGGSARAVPGARPALMTCARRRSPFWIVPLGSRRA